MSPLPSRFRFAAVALAALIFAPSVGADLTNAAAHKVTVSGSISGLSEGRVLVLSAQGVTWGGAIRGGSFRVLVPAKDQLKLRDATVQVVAASGGYIGPVILEKTAEKKSAACGGSNKPVCIDDVVGLGGASGSISLGRLVSENFRGSTPTWFLASKASSVDKHDAIRAEARNGRPYGAGNLGLIPGGIPKVTSGKTKGTLARAGAKAVASSGSDGCPTTTDPLDSSVVTNGLPAGTAPGQELDCSGVPNVFNVDVNGNGVLNIADTSATSIAASAITIGAKVHTAESSAISYYAPGGITTSALSSFLDPVTPAIGDNIIFNFAAASDALFPGDIAGNDVTLSVDCGGLNWCTNATLFDKSNTVGGPWSQTSPPFVFTPLGVAGDNGGFGANVLVPLGTNVPADVVPGQVVTVNGAQQGTGATAQTTMEVGPYFATTPYVVGATFTGPPPAAPSQMLTDSAGNNVSSGVGSGTLTLKVQRPERLPLPGETTSSGLMDISGLNYDVSITTKADLNIYANCPASTISNVSGATVENQPNNDFGFALVDNTNHDFDPAASDNPGPIELTLNPSACAASGGISWTTGSQYQVNISASGVVGNDSTAENFEVKA